MTDTVSTKITQALERLSKAFRVLLWQESKLHGISPVQIQILIFCATHTQNDVTVSFLAKDFDLTKATISDSIKVLLQKKLLSKVIDKNDSRSFALRLTAAGSKIAAKTGGFNNALIQSVENLSETEKENLLQSLLKIIYELNQQEVISIQRMCFTCFHYKKDGNAHYCNLLQQPLKKSELRIDCPEHELA